MKILHPMRSHVIYFKAGFTVTCFDHTDQSVIHLVNSYYVPKGYPVERIENHNNETIFEG